MQSTFSFFIRPIIVSLLAFAVIWYQAGTAALFVVVNQKPQGRAHGVYRRLYELE